MKKPTPQELSRRMQRAVRWIRPWESLFQPAFSGWEHIPDQRPLLFVGNHTLFGVLDAPFLWVGLYREKGIILRGLGDRFHFAIPGWRELVTRYGVVLGDPEECSRLMEAGETILVFPGGAREVTKRKDEQYKLIWKQRKGFARLAAKHQCTIVPFASVGIEDMFDVVLDGEDLTTSPLGRWMKRLKIREDVLFPLTIGRGPLGLPKLQRLYFHFAPPIHTADVDPDDEQQVWALREQTRAHVEDAISILRKRQQDDPQRFVFPEKVGL